MGVVDDTGRPLSSATLETEAEKGPVAGVAKLAEAGRKAVAESGIGWDQIAAVGLGSPGTMDNRAWDAAGPAEPSRLERFADQATAFRAIE